MNLLDYKDLKFSGIYLIRNTLDNKVYIGQSIHIAKRIKDHIRSVYNLKRTDSNNRLHNAIRKYGPERFELNIIEKCEPTDLNNREIYWISYYNSTNNEIGYNLTFGGDGSLYFGKKLTLDKLKYLYSLLAGEKLSYKQIANKFNISEDLVIKINKGINWRLDDYNYPIRKESTLLIYHYTGKCLLQLDLQDNLINKFTSISAAGRQLNLNSSVITKAANGSRKTAYKFKWKWEDCSEEDWLNLLNNELNQ